MRQEGEDSSERRVGIAHKGEAHIVGLRPFAVVGDGLHDAKGGLFARQSFEHLGFREEGIIESDGQDIRVAFRDERAGNAGWVRGERGQFSGPEAIAEGAQ